MRVVSKIDAGGLYTEDVLLEDGQALPSSCVEERPSEGFHRPKWDGSSWIEGKPTAEILEAAKASKRSQLKSAFRDHYEPTFEAGFLEVDYILDRLRRNLAVPQAERDKLTAVASGIDKLRGLFAQVNAAPQVAEVEGISW
jgi:hypothetical protein